MEPTKYKILSYNVMSSQNMAGLLAILDLERPDLVLLQENVLNSEHLNTFISSARGYIGASNVDESDVKKPGTAMVWKESLPVTNVTALEPNCPGTAIPCGSYQPLSRMGTAMGPQDPCTCSSVAPTRLPEDQARGWGCCSVPE